MRVPTVVRAYRRGYEKVPEAHVSTELVAHTLAVKISFDRADSLAYQLSDPGPERLSFGFTFLISFNSTNN